MTCSACSAHAENSLSGRYDAGCPQCEIRMLSHAPKHRREAFLLGIESDEERLKVKAAAVAEFQRRRAAG